MRAETDLSYSYSAWREPFGVAETPAEYVIHRPRLYLDTTIPSYLTAWTSRDLVTAIRGPERANHRKMLVAQTSIC